jgi:RNA polymerase sigma-70 factor (ECF subfamily)
MPAPPAPLADDRLLELLRDANTARHGFQLLVQQYQQPLYRQIRRMVIDHDDTDDLLQQTFIRAWNAIGNFRGDSALSTWLYRIAANECLAFLKRKRTRYFLPLHDVTAELEAKLSTQQLEAGPSGEEIQRQLQQAILQLPERQRLVFQYRYYDDMPYEQMAEVLGVTTGALKASYHHAVKKIEEFLRAG